MKLPKTPTLYFFAGIIMLWIGAAFATNHLDIMATAAFVTAGLFIFIAACISTP